MSEDPLAPLRTQIDQIDSDLIRLLAERAELVHKIGEIKSALGKEFYAPEREEELLVRLAKRSHAIGSRLPERSIRAIYREIMSAALALETDLKVAYLGPQGTWTHQAAIEKFGHSVDYLPMANFAEVFDAVSRQQANYGVVPIENSTEGAVNHTLDLFAESSLKICAQILLPIVNCFMRYPEATEPVARLYSHPQVFGQCRNWILREFPQAELRESASTTRAAQLAQGDAAGAVLGGALIAQQYQLDIQEYSIQDIATNTTRFLVLSTKSCPRTGRDRSSIMFSLKDRPGSLIAALRPFESLSINLSKIESRPSKRKDWEYYFFVDMRGHSEDEEVAQALEELEQHCSFLKILGSYPDSESPRETKFSCPEGMG